MPGSITKAELSRRIAHEHLRPTFRSPASSTLEVAARALAVRCWAHDPAERPTSLEVVESIARLQDNEECASLRGGAPAGTRSAAEHAHRLSDAAATTRCHPPGCGMSLARPHTTPVQWLLTIVACHAPPKAQVPSHSHKFAKLPPRAQARGSRRSMEDAAVILHLEGGALLLAVFDGHGGARAAALACQRLPALLNAAARNARPLGRGAWRALLGQAFYALEDELHADSEVAPSEGTTAVVVVVFKIPWST